MLKKSRMVKLKYRKYWFVSNLLEYNMLWLKINGYCRYLLSDIVRT